MKKLWFKEHNKSRKTEREWNAPVLVLWLIWRHMWCDVIWRVKVNLPVENVLHNTFRPYPKGIIFCSCLFKAVYIYFLAVIFWECFTTMSSSESDVKSVTALRELVNNRFYFKLFWNLFHSCINARSSFKFVFSYINTQMLSIYCHLSII